MTRFRSLATLGQSVPPCAARYVVIRHREYCAAEAGAFPNAARVISRWYPEGERGRVQGVMLAFAQMGAVFAPAGAAYLIEAAGWRWSFFAFGAIGIVWAVGFWFWFRNDPADH